MKMFDRRFGRCLIRGGSALALCWTVSGCVTGVAGSSVNGIDGEVVERSRETAPSWASLRPFTILDQDLSYGYVHIEQQQPDLPLGIKRTQLNALTQGKTVFKNEVTSLVSKAADIAGVMYDGIGKGIGTYVDAASDQTWGDHAKIADIFFEKFKPSHPPVNGLTEFYNIYVMVEVPKAAMTEALRSVSRRLKQSGKPEWRRLGQALDSRISLAD